MKTTQPPHLRPFGSLFPTIGATPGVYHVTLRGIRKPHVVEPIMSDADVLHLTHAFLEAIKPLLESAGFTLPLASLPLIRFMDGHRSTYHLDQGWGIFRPFSDYGKWDALCEYQPGRPSQDTPSSLDLFLLNLDNVVLVWMTLSRSHPTDPGFGELQFEDLRRKFTALALFHALSLWVVYQSLIVQEQIPIPDISNTRDSLFFHESIACLLVHHVVSCSPDLLPQGLAEDPDLGTLLTWMKGATSPLYKAYERLGGDAENVLKVLRILPGASIQSFELLEHLFKLKHEHGEVEINILFDRYFRSPFYPDSQASSMQEVKAYLDIHFPFIAERYKVRVLANKFGL
jgi:hypothetical protein